MALWNGGGALLGGAPHADEDACESNSDEEIVNMLDLKPVLEGINELYSDGQESPKQPPPDVYPLLQELDDSHVREHIHEKHSEDFFNPDPGRDQCVTLPLPGMMQSQIAFMPVLVNPGLQGGIMPMQMHMPLQMGVPLDSIGVPMGGLTMTHQPQAQDTEKIKSSSGMESSTMTNTMDGAPKAKNGKSKRSVVVELRLGRQRIAQSDIAVVSGMHVIVAVSRGFDIGTVTETTPASIRSRAGRARIVRQASAEEINTVVTDIRREEERALSLARSLVCKYSVPLALHCACIQFDKRRIDFHYSSTQKHPDFRCLLDVLHARFRCRIWFNNCRPDHGCPGDPIDAKYLQDEGNA